MARDVLDVLAIQDTTKAMAQLDADDKQTKKVGLRGRTPWLISEAGLYSLVMRSNKPEAKQFARWVTKDVLPSLRKHGLAMTAETAKAVIETPEVLMARALVVAQETIAKLAGQAKGMSMPWRLNSVSWPGCER